MEVHRWTSKSFKVHIVEGVAVMLRSLKVFRPVLQNPLLIYYINLHNYFHLFMGLKHTMALNLC